MSSKPLQAIKQQPDIVPSMKWNWQPQRNVFFAVDNRRQEIIEAKEPF